MYTMLPTSKYIDFSNYLQKNLLIFILFLYKPQWCYLPTIAFFVEAATCSHPDIGCLLIVQRIYHESPTKVIYNTISDSCHVLILQSTCTY